MKVSTKVRYGFRLRLGFSAFFVLHENNSSRRKKNETKERTRRSLLHLHLLARLYVFPHNVRGHKPRRIDRDVGQDLQRKGTEIHFWQRGSGLIIFTPGLPM